MLPSVLLLLFSPYVLVTVFSHNIYPISFGYGEIAETEQSRCRYFRSTTEVSVHVVNALVDMECYEFPHYETGRKRLSAETLNKVTSKLKEDRDFRLKDAAFWKFKLATHQTLKYSTVEAALDLFGVNETDVNKYFDVHLAMRYEIYSTFNYTLFCDPRGGEYGVEVCGTRNPTRFYGHAFKHYSFGSVTNNGLVYRYRDNEQIFFQNELTQRMVITQNCTQFSPRKIKCERGWQQYDEKVLAKAPIKTVPVNNGVWVQKVEDKMDFVATTAKLMTVNSSQLIQIVKVPKSGRFLLELPKRWSAEVSNVRIVGTGNTFLLTPIEGDEVPPMNHGDINDFEHASKEPVPKDFICALHETVPFAVSFDNLMHFFRDPLTMFFISILVLVVMSSTYLRFCPPRSDRKVWVYDIQKIAPLETQKLSN